MTSDTNPVIKQRKGIIMPNVKQPTREEIRLMVEFQNKIKAETLRLDQTQIYTNIRTTKGSR